MKQNIYNRIHFKLNSEVFYKELNEFQNIISSELSEEIIAQKLGNWKRKSIDKNKILSKILESDFRKLREYYFDNKLIVYYDGINRYDKLIDSFMKCFVFLAGLAFISFGYIDTIENSVSVGLNYKLQTTVMTGPFEILIGIIFIFISYFLVKK